MDAIIFLLFIISLTFTALLLNSFHKQENRIAFLLGVMIINYGVIILITEIASILHVITVPFLLSSLLVLCILSWLIWRRQGKPSLAGPFQDGKWAIWREFPPFRSHPALYILAFGVFIVYIFGAYLIITLPQHNYDSMTYHLSRVGYWMQHQTLAPWATPNPRQIASPINAEVGLMWLIMFWGTDQLTGFVQWFAALGIAIAIYGIARLLGASRSQGAFASLIWATFPQIVLQSTTTQNDLVATFFFISMLYFLFLGLRDQKYQPLILSGIALGLAVGTKATIFFVLPGLAIAVGINGLLNGKLVFRKLIYWSLFCILGIGLLGAFTFVQNQSYYGNPFSVSAWTSSITSSGPHVSWLARGTTNLIIYFSQLVDFAGVPESVAHPFLVFKAGLLEWLLLDSGLPFHSPKVYSISRMLMPSSIIHEDTTWFGPLSFLLLIPSTIIQLFRGIQKKDFFRLTLVIVGIGFVFILSFWFGWSPYRGRYFVLAVSILAPLMAMIYQPVEKKRLLFGLATFVALWIMVSTVLLNDSKPLIGSKAIWGMDSNSHRMSNNQKMVPVLEMVEKNVPSEAVMGTRLGVDHWDYILFGEKFGRIIVPLDPTYRGIDMDLINNTDIEYLLVAPRERPFLEIPSGLVWIDDVSGWYLLKISNQGAEKIPEGIGQQLLGLQDEKMLLDVDESFAGVVGLTELFSADWGVETEGANGLKWLGEGLNQGLRFFLWSEEEMPISVVFSLQLGPSRDDLERNLEITYYRYGAYGPVFEGSVKETLRINSDYTYEMVVQLQKGLNEFRIFSLDRATIPVLPNGDERPLLVRLNDVQVLPFENEPQISLIEASLAGDLQVIEQYLPPWGLETFEDEPFLWLGEGIESGYRSYIWSEVEQGVRLIFHLAPGPAREDQTRNLDVSITRSGFFEDSSAFHEVLTIDDPGQYQVEIKLDQGLSQLDLFVLDEATIETLPNGDNRPLLARLNLIEIVPIDE